MTDKNDEATAIESVSPFYLIKEPAGEVSTFFGEEGSEETRGRERFILRT